MASKAALRWRDGRGWLILTGATPSGDEIRGRALRIAAADGGVAYVATQGTNQAADQLLADMADLGAQSGFLVDVLTEDDETIRERLAEAGMIVIAGDASVTNVRSVLLGAAIAGIQAAFENGAVVLVEGPSAMAWGGWTMLDSGEITTGLDWLRGALVVPGSASVGEAPETQGIMHAQPGAIAVGIGPNSALALGPDGEVEPWGQQEVSIALGPTFGA
jgi:hypothetical protein